jgi:surface antigen
MKMKPFVILLAVALAACSNPPSKPEPAPSTTSVTPAPSASAASTPDCSAGINGYCFGFGTYYVATRRDVPRDWGNAASWYANAQESGFEVGETPKKNAIAWTAHGPYGQVAIVEEVLNDGTKVRISEMYGKGGGWNIVTTREVPADWFKYIY